MINSEKPFKAGEVVLISFPFTDGVGIKKRPALVVFDSKDGDFILARITSKSNNSIFDFPIIDWKSAGLLIDSTVRLHKLATLEISLIDKALGILTAFDFKTFEAKFKQLSISIFSDF
jgi:mRNA interferase MazF